MIYIFGKVAPPPPHPLLNKCIKTYFKSILSPFQCAKLVNFSADVKQIVFFCSIGIIKWCHPIMVTLWAGRPLCPPPPPPLATPLTNGPPRSFKIFYPNGKPIKNKKNVFTTIPRNFPQIFIEDHKRKNRSSQQFERIFSQISIQVQKRGIFCPMSCGPRLRITVLALVSNLNSNFRLF